MNYWLPVLVSMLVPDLSLTNGVNIPCQNGVWQQTWSPQASYHQGHLLQYHHGNQLTVQSRQVSSTVSSPGVKKEKIHQTLFKCYHIDFWCDAFIGLSMYALFLFNSYLHDAISYKLNFFILMRYVLLLDFSFLSMNISTLCFDYNLVYCIFILFTYCIMVCLSVGEAGWDL